MLKQVILFVFILASTLVRKSICIPIRDSICVLMLDLLLLPLRGIFLVWHFLMLKTILFFLQFFRLCQALVERIVKGRTWAKGRTTFKLIDKLIGFLFVETI